MRCATVKPKIAPSMFAVTKPIAYEPLHQSNTSKRRTESLEVQRVQQPTRDDYGDDEIDDNELLNMPLDGLEFDDIDNFANIANTAARNSALNNKSNKEKARTLTTNTATDDDHEQGPVQLDNGKWACNHKCKDKTACKHLCCREGVDKPPRKVAKKATSDKNASQPVSQMSTQKDKKLQTKLQLTATKRKNPNLVEELDLTQPEKKSKSGSATNNPEYRRLEHLHQNIQSNKPTPSASTIFAKKPEQAYHGIGQTLSFLQKPANQRHETSSDYGDMYMDEFTPEPSTYGNENENENGHSYAALIPDSTMNYSAKAPVASQRSDTFDDDSLLGDAMIGLADSQNLASIPGFNDSGVQLSEGPTGFDYDYDYEVDLQDDDFPTSIEAADVNDILQVEQIEPLPHTDFPNVPERPPSTHYGPVHFQPTTAHSAPQEPEKSLDTGATGLPSVTMTTATATAMMTTCRQISDKSWDFDSSIFDLLSQSDGIHHDVNPNAPSGGATMLECEASGMVKQPDNHVCKVKEEEMPDDFKGLQSWLFEEFGDIVEIEDD
jgi:ATP-dependent DNA helicase HFM1/MER3